MSLFAMADLHLSLSTNKPMDVFGDSWHDYENRINEEWRASVRETDTVLVPGDISWGMTMEEALMDLQFLDSLPGKKILSKGNHDYWWGTNGRVEDFLQTHGLTTMSLLKNNAFLVDDTAVCGTRGWILPDNTEWKTSDRTVYERELGRLERSLICGTELLSSIDGRLVVMLHYPPITDPNRDTDFSLLLEKYHVDVCVYGHIHGRGHKKAFEGVRNGTEYRLISADYISFKPLRL